MHLPFLVTLLLHNVTFFLNLARYASFMCVRASPSIRPFFTLIPARSSHNSSFETAVKRLNAARHKRQVAADVRWYSLARAINRREISFHFDTRADVWRTRARVRVCMCVCVCVRPTAEHVCTAKVYIKVCIRASILAVVPRRHFSRWKSRLSSAKSGDFPAAILRKSSVREMNLTEIALFFRLLPCRIKRKICIHYFGFFR